MKNKDKRQKPILDEEEDEENDSSSSSGTTGGGTAKVFTPETLLNALNHALEQDARNGIFSPQVVKQLKEEVKAMEKTLEKAHDKSK